MSTNLVSIKERIKAALAENTRAFEQPSMPRITTTNKKFTFPNGTATNKPLQAVILDFRNTRTYYKSWNPNDPQPPVCFAMAKEIDTLTPSAKAPEPQADDCASCPKNQWGSDPNGGKGKACKNGVRLIIAPANLGEDKEVDRVDLFALDVSPTGLRSWGPYLSRLDSAQVLPMQMVTEISFNPEETYATLLFQELHPNEDLERTWSLYERSQHMLKAHPSEK